jgi:dephospho-CoA kinase
LYEAGLDRFVNQVWYVETDPQIQLDRLMKRNNLSKEDAQKRIDAQHIYRNKEKADKIIYNNGDEEQLRKLVLEIIKCR